MGLQDVSAHRACADALTRDVTLRASLPSVALRWGAQSPGAGFDLTQSHTTWLDSLVWTRMYLSTFAFPGGHSVERAGERIVVRVPVQFRNALDAGEFFNYPNPLCARHDIVDEIVKNRMPPAQDGVAAGIADLVYRRELLSLAEAFAATSDRALEFEHAHGL